jgi:hypothetical protein
MGYDRGELLSTLTVWLVVEGPTDRAVLDVLFAGRLHRAGVAVVPLHGTARWQGLLEADALWRYVTAPVAVMFDNVGSREVQELNDASEQELEAISRGAQHPNELRDLAKLIRTARSWGRQVHPVPGDGADIFSHLDDDAVRAVFPDYPGRAEAEKRWQRHNKGSHDRFLRERFGVVKDPEKFAAIAEEMVRKGATAPALDEAVEFCEQLGASAMMGETTTSAAIDDTTTPEPEQQ